MADQPLPGYPQSFGARMINVTNHTGPALYVAGGETYDAVHMGWGSFDKVETSQSWNANNAGNYSGRVYYPTNQTGNNVTGSNSVKILWIAANGTEAANNTVLSAEYIRVLSIGG